jgi:peptidoglycan/LPS O-acetylase OafA/YrhL
MFQPATMRWAAGSAHGGPAPAARPARNDVTQPIPGSPGGPPDAGAVGASPAFYRPELDGLRFFAFLAVYLNHTLLFGVGGHHQHMSDRLAHLLGTIGTAGAFGVDLFFALSAYLITELLLRERQARQRLDVRAFYLRRILRIWPLYFLFLALARLLAALVPSEHLSWLDVAAFALFSGNWAYAAHPVVTVAAPLWSVSVEEQFYLIWPWAVRRGSLRRIVLAAVGMVAVGMALRFALAEHGIYEQWISKGSLTRVDGIAAGALLAVALKGRVPRLGVAARLGLLGAGLAALLWVAATFDLLVPPFDVAHEVLGWPLVAVASVAILLSALGADGLPFRLLRSRPLVYLGRISYGLYVFHQVGLLLSGDAFPHYADSKLQWASHLLVGLAITVALAAASYRFVELPFLRLKQRFTVVRSRPQGAAA